MVKVFPKSYIPDEDISGKELESDDSTPDRMCFRCLLFVIPLVLCTSFVSLYIVYRSSRDEAYPTIEYNELLDNWIATSNDTDIDGKTRRTAQLLQLYGNVNSFDDIVSDIIKYEELLLGIQNKVKQSTPTSIRFVPLDYLANLTTPHVKMDKWISLFAKYTNNSYDRNGWLLIQPPGLEIVREMLDTVAVGREGTNYMIFWNVYLQTLFYAVPRFLIAGKNPVEACYEHVAKAVKVALITPCLQAVLHGESLQHVTKLLQHVKATIRGSIASSKWFNGSVETYALQKLDQIKLRIGAPDYPNLTLESVADFYSQYLAYFK